MADAPVDRTEGSRMYDELIAVHTIMRRGTELVTTAFGRLATGRSVDVRTLVGTSRWLIEFVHHHHQSEDDLFWPVLRELFPEEVAELDRLTVQHEALDTELGVLSRAVAALSPPGGPKDAAVPPAVSRDAAAALSSAEKVEELLLGHLDEEEPVLRTLFPRVPGDRIVRLRTAIVRGAPRTGPHLVVGLMEYPEHAPGYGYMLSNFPPPVRWMRPLLLNRYRVARKALGAAG